MVDPQTTLGEQLLDLAIGERKAQVPADREPEVILLPSPSPADGRRITSGSKWRHVNKPEIEGGGTSAHLTSPLPKHCNTS